MGELDLNTRLLSFLSRHGIGLHVFNYYGFYVGSFYPRETRAAGQVGRFSLALDLAELFKPLVVDRMAFALMNRGALGEDDFLEEVGFCYLTKGGRKKVVMEFEERMRETIQHPRLKRPVSYRTLIRLEAYKLVRHLLGMEPYEPLKAWW